VCWLWHPFAQCLLLSSCDAHAACRSGPYCAIVYSDTSIDDPAVMPLYYGLWFFATATANHSVIYSVNVKTTNPYVRAWHVRDAGGVERVVILHKDPSNNAVPPTTAEVTVVPVTPLQSPAVAVTLSAGSAGLGSQKGLSFGGLTFDGTQVSFLFSPRCVVRSLLIACAFCITGWCANGSLGPN
jgi:hypothetical protein